MTAPAAMAAFDAVMNGAAAVLVLAAYIAIKRGKVKLHKRLMITAVCASAIFLTSYLVRHALFGVTHFAGTGGVRTAYFTLLGSHTLLAVAVPVLVLRTLYLGLKSRFGSHRKIARWTLPIWAYVSVTGVLVYLMLFHLPHGS